MNEAKFREIKNAKRIIVTGDAGRGKSTFAKKLASKLNMPLHSTDDYFWAKKFSVPADKDESLKKLKKIYETEQWIVEGTSRYLIEPGLKTADTIIYMKFRSTLSQWVVLFKRHLNRDDETLLNFLRLLRHVFYKRHKLGYTKSQPSYQDIINPFNVKTIYVSSYKEINDLLEAL